MHVAFSYSWLFCLFWFGWYCLDLTASRIIIEIDSSSSEGDSRPPNKMYCKDQMKNGDETDIDCGGTRCPKCDDGMACKANCDCISGICRERKCMGQESCIDNIKNQDETDIDCGGIKCTKCRDTKNCIADSDCFSNICTNNTCSPSNHCLNDITDVDETDVNCGGLKCPKCGDTKHCQIPSDCIGGSCIDHICISPVPESCTDNVKNQDETDVDCGGAKCPTCGNTKSCNQGSDCISGSCINNVCVPAASCNDNVKNQDETDIDCGGLNCPKCGDTKNCKNSSDCLSGSCKNNACVPAASCTDNVKNQDETDVDCGGAKCPACGNTKSCNLGSDCSSGYCDSNHICSNPTVATTSANPTTSSSPASVNASATTSNYYGTESISLRPSTSLSNVIIVVTVQKTVGAKWTGMFNNFPGGSMTESHTDNGAQVTYTWQSTGSVSIGSTGGPYTATAQFDLIGTAQPTTGDTYTITIKDSNGQTSTLSGHF